MKITALFSVILGLLISLSVTASPIWSLVGVAASSNVYFAAYNEAEQRTVEGDVIAGVPVQVVHTDGSQFVFMFVVDCTDNTAQIFLRDQKSGEAVPASPSIHGFKPGTISYILHQRLCSTDT
ncbi:MAG: hypothetical protein WBR29_08560 [Gammaproteobacteria bacterium]